jgi:tRNA(fMet)-specific endonuclease VapC
MNEMPRLHDTNSLIALKKKQEALEEGKDFTTIFSIIEYPKALELENLTIIFPDKTIYEDAIKLSVLLLEKGIPIPAMDILIACIALNKNLELITTDKHFDFVKSVNNNLQLQ